jgi:molybdopterin/thiamine biosynthesis adenylyltransferase
MIGTIQAAETLKLLSGTGEVLSGRLLLVDALAMELRTIRIRKDPRCAVCGTPGSAAAPAGKPD